MPPPLSWTILSPMPSIYTFVPSGNTDKSAAIVTPSCAKSPPIHTPPQTPL